MPSEFRLILSVVVPRLDRLTPSANAFAFIWWHHPTALS